MAYCPFSIDLSVTPMKIDFLPEDDIKQGNLIMKKIMFQSQKGPFIHDIVGMQYHCGQRKK